MRKVGRPLRSILATVAALLVAVCVAPVFAADSGNGAYDIEIDWPSADMPSSEPASLCARLGYTDQGPKPGIQFARLIQGADLPSPASAYFPLSTFRLRDRSRVGVLHIFAFSAKRYIDLCEEARTKLGLAPNAPCDDACSDRIQLGAEDALTQRLTGAISALKALPDLRALVVDLTGNGGGSAWLEPAARELSARALLSPQMGFVRSDVWTAELQSRIDAIAAGLPKVGAAAQPMFEQARDSYARLLAAARGRCDRSGIPTKLSHSGASVRLPDCIQFRADGTNAVAGITPDVLVPWRLNDSDYQRAERAYEGAGGSHRGVH